MFFQITPSDQLALISSDGRSYTYSDLAQWIEHFRSLGLCRTLAFLLCDNVPESVIGYLSCLNIGIVPLMLDRRIDPQLLSRLLQRYRPACLYLPSELAADFPDCSTVTQCGHYTLLQTPFSAPALHPDLALLLTTSGSTGSPKLVRQSYRNLQSNAEAIAQYLHLTASERPVTTLPMYYTYGLSVINSHLQAGATILLTGHSVAMLPFWRFFREQEATSLAGVPFTYQTLKRIRFFRMELPALRYLTQAGGKLDPALHREFAHWAEAHGKAFIVMYGQTEATARMSYLPAEHSLTHCGSIGIPIPGGQFRLIDEDGVPITAPNVPGELVYEGQNVMMGYAISPDDLAMGDQLGGILHTGDVAQVDRDGFYSIVGRKKRFLKLFGSRVNLDEIEALLHTQFPQIDCAVSGSDDRLVVYLNQQEQLTEIKQWLSSTIHISESGIFTVFLEQLPRNESGKLLYTQLPQL